MRLRTAFALLVLALPAMLPAQARRRAPKTGVQRPPKELPPRAPGIKDAQYRSSRFSFDGYPLISFVQSEQYLTSIAPANLLMGGLGSRLGFRLNQDLSLTADLTQSFGNRVQMTSGDLGARWMPIGDGQSRPYLDARLSYGDIRNSFNSLNSFGNYDSYDSQFIAEPQNSTRSYATSHGFGGVVGVGFETEITTRITFTSGIAYAVHRMDAFQNGTTGSGQSWNYNAKSVRFTAGIRYTPQHEMR